MAHICSRQLDTSLSCKTKDAGPVHRVVCLFTPQFSPVPIGMTCWVGVGTPIFCRCWPTSVELFDNRTKTVWQSRTV